MSQRDLDAIDPGFVDDLASSVPATRAVAEWLLAKGFPVLINPTLTRPDPSQRRDYSDRGDLFIQQRVEVKHRPRMRPFTCAADFPFKTIIVDVASKVDRILPSPYMYVIANQALTHAAVIPVSSTRDKWVKTRRHNPTTAGREQDFYECPIELVKFVKLQT